MLSAQRGSSSSPSVELNDSDTTPSTATSEAVNLSNGAGHGRKKSASDAPLPHFLRQTRQDIHSAFVDLEWQQRHRLAQGMQTPTPPETTSPWARVAGEEVAKRNRYMNVDPYASNRVRLKVPEGHSDYINASPIKLADTKTGEEKYFIATQGPKEGIQAHMWRMIQHETADPAVIVMLTQTHESGREKCFQYFPHSMDDPVQQFNEEDEFGDGVTATLTLKSIVEDESTRSTVRELELQTEGVTKTVWHLLFEGWPDFLIPEGEDRAALLNLVKLSAEKNSPGSPRVVHCSAGVGRSGTFIALDYLLAELASGNLDDTPAESDPIAEVVDKLRQQRMMMVQGEQQFWFLYDVLRDMWVERWLALQGEDVSARVESSPEVEQERVEVRKRGELERELQGNVERL